MIQTSTASVSPISQSVRLSTWLARLSALGMAVILGVVIARGLWFALYGAAALPLVIAPPAGLAGPSGNARAVAVEPALGLFANRLGGDSSGAVVVAPESRLNIALRGVRVGQDPQSGSAIIVADSGRQRNVRVGDTITDGISVDAIYADRIVINRRGAREAIYLRDRERRQARQLRAQPVATSMETLPASSRAAVDVRDLIEALDLGPRIRNGAFLGLEIGADADGALAAQYSLQQGDLITAVNGVSMSAPERLADALARAGAPRITLVRDGQTMTVTAPTAAIVAQQE